MPPGAGCSALQPRGHGMVSSFGSPGGACPVPSMSLPILFSEKDRLGRGCSGRIGFGTRHTASSQSTDVTQVARRALDTWCAKASKLS